VVKIVKATEKKKKVPKEGKVAKDEAFGANTDTQARVA
jgi:hypothetical protein